MKVNINDFFDEIDNQVADKIPPSSIITEQDKDLTKRIKENVMAQINPSTSKKNSKKRPLHFGKLVAIAAVIAVFISSVSVGAANYFKPDNALNQMIELNGKVDYSTLGTNVDKISSSNGLDFYISQVLCDNNVMCIPLECPEYNGRYVLPDFNIIPDESENFCFTVNDIDSLYSLRVSTSAQDIVTGKETEKKNIAYLTLSDLKNIKNNSVVKLSFDKLEYFDREDDNDICDANGKWEFEFTINRSNTRQKLKVNDLYFENGEQYIAKNFTISPLGFTYNFRIKYGDATGEFKGTETNLPKPMPKALKGQSIIFSEHLARVLSGTPFVVIEMKDGTIYDDAKNDIESNCQVGENLVLKTTDGDLIATFNTAIDIENIKSITIIDKVIYEG